MADVIIPEENLSNLLPSRLPSHIKAYYDGKQSMIFTGSVAPSGQIVKPDPDNPGHQLQWPRLDYLDLNSDILGGRVQDAKINAWCDLYSWPTQGIIISNPTLKENYVEIPGGSGSLDFAESLTGYPLYANRTGSITWEVDPYRDGMDIETLILRINSILHGKRMYAIQIDDVKMEVDAYGESRPVVEYSPWYYEGRLTVDSISLGESSPQWNLNYNFKPFKKLLWTTSGNSSGSPRNSYRHDWVWDIFDFDNGIDYPSEFDLTISGTNYSRSIGSWIGNMPTVPTLTINSTLTQDQCRSSAQLDPIGGTAGSELGMLIRAHDDTGRSNNPQDTGYVWVANCTNKKVPELTMCGSGIQTLYDSATGEEMGDETIVLDIYGTGTILFDMPIGVI